MATTSVPSSDRPLTHRDLENMPDDGNRYEVIDGLLYLTPFPFTSHQRAATRILDAINRHLEKHPVGEAFMAGLKVVLDEPTGVGPDVVFIANEHKAALKEDGFYGPPDLVVEVVSSKPALDRVVKFNKYATAGVRHYWIIDPGSQVLEAYELVDQTYVSRARLAGDVTFEPGIFPGRAIDLSRLWA